MSAHLKPRRALVASAVALATGVWLVGGLTAPALAHGRSAGHRPLWVSPSDTSTRAGQPCRTTSFHSISAAVAAAPSGGKVIVCRGTYHEDVLISKALTLMGHHATIDATG